MLHIALVTTSYPDEAPGSEAAGSFVEDFALELSSMARVTVIAASTSDSISTTGNLTVRRFAVPRLPLSQLKPGIPGHWPAIFQTLHRGSTAVKTLAKLDRPDHIFALWTLPSGYWASTVAKKYRVPFSTWALGSDIWSLGKVPIVRNLLRRVLRDACTRYADGYQLATEVEAICGKDCLFLPSTRQISIGNTPPLSDKPPYKLAFLGRWHPNKGVDLMLDALSLLTDADWMNIDEIRVFGGGPLEDLVKEQVRHLQDDSRPVTFGGYLGKEQAAELIGWADYLLLPSRIESIPVIFSDSMKLNTPVIATPAGDLPALIARYQCGITATDITSGNFAIAIQEALNNAPRSFEAAMLQVQAEFDLPAITTTFLNSLPAGKPL